MKILALALIVGGALALAYGGFSYTRDSHNLTLGDLQLSVKDHETVNVPAWAGVGAVVVGAAMFFVREKTA
jgi:TRAP-type C4-dicarboxylate transport system permease small subunit